MPRDGKTFGALKVRGPWVAAGYYKRSGDDVFESDGWFNTGDVATICPLGYMQITDRTKDVIKSGGEWISSIELENLAVAHPAVAQAAAIAIPHPKWQERPLLVAVLKPGASLTYGGAAAVLRGQGGEVVDSGGRGVRREAAADGDGQAQQVATAPAVRGLPVPIDDDTQRKGLPLARRGQSLDSSRVIARPCPDP